MYKKYNFSILLVFCVSSIYGAIAEKELQEFVNLKSKTLDAVFVIKDSLFYLKPESKESKQYATYQPIRETIAEIGPILENYTLKRVVRGKRVDYVKWHPHIVKTPILFSMLQEGNRLVFADKTFFHFYEITKNGKKAHVLGTLHHCLLQAFPNIVVGKLKQASTIMIEHAVSAPIKKSDKPLIKEFVETKLSTTDDGVVDVSDNPAFLYIKDRMKSAYDVDIDLTKININVFIHVITQLFPLTLPRMVYMLYRMALLKKGGKVAVLPVDTYLALYSWKNNIPLSTLETNVESLQTFVYLQEPSFRSLEYQLEAKDSPETKAEKERKNIQYILANIEKSVKFLQDPMDQSIIKKMQKFKNPVIAPLWIERYRQMHICLKLLHNLKDGYKSDDIVNRNKIWVKSIQRQMDRQSLGKTVFIAGGISHFEGKKSVIASLLTKGFKIRRYNPFTKKWKKITLMPKSRKSATGVLL